MFRNPGNSTLCAKDNCVNPNLYSVKICDPSNINTGKCYIPISYFSDPENEFMLMRPTILSGVRIADEFEKLIKNGHVYYSLPHRKEYEVKMTNSSDSRVNVILKIDGEVMGKWRINARSEIIIERPAHSNRKFTFVKETSSEGRMAGVKPNDKNGLIEVTFIPEKEPIYLSRTLGGELKSYSFATSSGATVLGENSFQRFGQASEMIEDKSRAVTKRIRLVINKPLISIKTKNFNDYDNINDDPIPPKFY